MLFSQVYVVTMGTTVSSIGLANKPPALPPAKHNNNKASRIEKLKNWLKKPNTSVHAIVLNSKCKIFDALKRVFVAIKAFL